MREEAEEVTSPAIFVPDAFSGRDRVSRQPAGVVPESDARSVAAAYGLKVPRSIIVPRGQPVPEDLPVNAPYVVKIISSTLVHKSDVDGVRVGLVDRDEVVGAIDDMSGRLGDDVDGFLIDELVPADHELLVGGRVDAVFGPTITVGFGGVLVELLEDVAVRLCPIVERDVADMLGGLRAYALLTGHRGKPAADLDAIYEAVLAVGGDNGLLTQCSDLLDEMDVNPLRVNGSHAIAVDVRLVRSSKDNDHAV
jgi:hypothetical protein